MDNKQKVKPEEMIWFLLFVLALVVIAAGWLFVLDLVHHVRHDVDRLKQEQVIKNNQHKQDNQIDISPIPSKLIIVHKCLSL